MSHYDNFYATEMDRKLNVHKVELETLCAEYQAREYQPVTEALTGLGAKPGWRRIAYLVCDRCGGMIMNVTAHDTSFCRTGMAKE